MWVIQSELANESTDMATVKTVSDLRSLQIPNVDGYCMILLGYYSPGDIGAATSVYWSASSTANDNGGSVFSPVSSPASGRWIVHYDGVVNVRCFGAVGDGSADDTVAIESAMAIGLRTYFPAVTGLTSGYRVTRTITAPRIDIIGDGANFGGSSKTSTIWAREVVGPLFGQLTSGACISGISIDWRNGTSGLSETATGLWDRTTSSDIVTHVRCEDTQLLNLATSGAKAFDATNCSIVSIKNVSFSAITNGYGFFGKGNSTIISMDNPHFNYTLECITIDSSITSQLNVRGGDFGYSTIALALRNVVGTFSGTYFEGMGHPIYAGDVALSTNGLGVGDIAGAVDSPFNVRHGSLEFSACDFYQNTSEKPAFWYVGKQSPFGLAGEVTVSGGRISFNGCIGGAYGFSTRMLADMSTENRGGFRVDVNDPGQFLGIWNSDPIETTERSSGVVRTYLDARAVTSGSIYLLFGSPTGSYSNRFVVIENGHFVYGCGAESDAYSSPPNVAPYGGTNKSGDIVNMSRASIAEGGPRAQYCSVDGTPGTWVAIG